MVGVINIPYSYMYMYAVEEMYWLSRITVPYKIIFVGNCPLHSFTRNISVSILCKST